MSYVTMPDDTKLYCVQEGAGRPLVLLHGWKASSNVYNKAASLLMKKFLCIRYDHRGHLRSDVPVQMPTMADLAEDLAEVIRQKCAEKPVLVGWSMGGGTVLEYVKRYGCEEIAGIVIVDFPPCMLNDATWRYGRSGGQYTKETLYRDIEWMKLDFLSYLDNYYSNSIPGYDTLPAEEKQKQIKERMQGHNPQVLTSLWESLISSDYRDILPRISVPVAIFHAGIKPSCCVEAAQYYMESIPTEVRRIYFSDASHALISEQPERFAIELEKFIHDIKKIEVKEKAE